MKNNFEILYERLGLLFYAAALRQKALRIDDYESLMNIIEGNWKAGAGIQDRLIRDELYRHMAASVKGAFKNSMGAGEASQLFNVFYALHALSFDFDLKERIVKTYGQIAREFSPTHEDAARTEWLQKLLTTEGDIQHRN